VEGKRVVPEQIDKVRDAFVGFIGGLKIRALGVDDEPLECPDQFLWELHNRMRTLGGLPEAGGILDQPVMLMAELGAVDEAWQIQTPALPANNTT